MEASKRRRGRRTTFGRKKGSRKRKQSKKIKLFGRVFSDSCGFCVAMRDEWKKITELSVKPPMKDIGENYDEEIKRINDQFKTTLTAAGLPTIYRIIEISSNKFEVDYYKSERTADKIMKWVRS
jgi:hypothetical protein